jgi:hypothetical protein
MHRWEDDIEWESVDLIQLSEDRNKWRAVVSILMDLEVL